MGKNINTKLECRINRTESVESFLKDIRQYPVMTKEETTNAFIRLQNGDESAREEIFNANLRFMFSVASKFANGDDILDLVNEMAFGMRKAIDTFDYQMGYSFISYAVHWLYACVSEYRMKYSNIVRNTIAYRNGQKANKVSEKFFATNGRMPSEDELLDILETEYNMEIKGRMDLFSVKSESMDNVIDEDGTTAGEIGEVAMATAAGNEYEGEMDREHNQYVAEKILSKLPLKHREIIEMYFGIGKYEGESMDKESIGERIGISSERVRQIIEGSLGKLRDMAQRKVIAW